MRHTEKLETRRLLSSYSASSVAELIADMNAANAAGGSNTITLAAAAAFKISAVDNNTGGPNGLPVIVAGDDLTILGNGDTLQRSTAKRTPAFRLFYVLGGGSLSLSGVSLSNGLASVQSHGYGGAIANLGTLRLNAVTIENCAATPQSNSGDGDSALGGGIYSNGVLTVADSTLRSNQAIGGDGAVVTSNLYAGRGGSGLGGAIYVAGGSASLTNTTFSSNGARGGNGANGGTAHSRFTPNILYPGGPGGNGFGGALYAAGGTIEVTRTSITQNSAAGGAGGSSPKGTDGVGQGGGIYVALSALATLDSFTVAHTSGNSASTSDNDTFGSFSVL